MTITGTKVSEGYFNGKKVLRVELRDTFRATTTWEALGNIPPQALEWDLRNESTSNSLDVNFQEDPDPTAPPFQTLETGGGGPSDLDPGDWRPQFIHVRGTSGEGYYLYYIIEPQFYADGGESYLEALRHDSAE